MGWHSVLAGLALGARFFVSSGSSGSRAGGLALGFGRFVAWSAFFSSVRAAQGAGQAGWHSGLAGLALGARFFISSGSSGSRAGGLALGFGRFVAWSAFFSSVRAAQGAGQAGWHSGLAGLALGARFFISSGSSGSRAGGLALGFGGFGGFGGWMGAEQ